MSAAWIPNTLTLGNLACGFVSLVFASRNSGEGHIFAAGFLIGAFLMVSTVRYSKPQSFILKNLHGFKQAGLTVLVALLLFRFGFRFIFLFIVLYVLSGIVGFLIKFIEEHWY